jgi:small GTP-binding protein
LGFDVQKNGDARVAIIGFPSVGKSTFLSTVTTTQSAVAAYEFTTLTCVPSTLEYKDAKIQLLDLPGIIEGAAEGKGRGKQVINVARTSDLILMMLDAGKAEVQKGLLQNELEQVGLRLNQSPPDLTLTKKAIGGIKFNATVPLTHLNEGLVKTILHEYRIHNAEILVREDATVDQFLDVVEGNRVYLKCLYVVNKIDTITIEEVDRMAHQPDTVVLSCASSLNIEYVKVRVNNTSHLFLPPIKPLISLLFLFVFHQEMIWEYLHLIRIYCKPKSQAPDIAIPVIMRNHSTVVNFCRAIHRQLEQTFNYALVWGTSVKHRPQRVGKRHVLEDEDVVQIMQKV